MQAKKRERKKKTINPLKIKEIFLIEPEEPLCPYEFNSVDNRLRSIGINKKPE